MPPFPKRKAADLEPPDDKDVAPPSLPKGGVDVDGSVLEGGGQVLRVASALSAIVARPIRVDNIRAGRSTPGLRPQHATGLQLVRQLCGGCLVGCDVGSRLITLVPGQLRAGEYVGDIGTAGSVTLLAQAALPCLLLAAPRGGGDSSLRAGTTRTSTLDLRGGTDTAMAPPYDYLARVLLPTLRRRLGVSVGCECVRRGFYPRGGGRVKMSVEALPAGRCLPPLQLMEQGDVTEVQVHVFAAGRVPEHVPQQLEATTEAKLREALLPGVPVVTSVHMETKETAVGDGCGLCVTLHTSTGMCFGGAVVGSRGVPAPQLAEEVVQRLRGTLDQGACVDEWMQDQLVIFMALASGVSRVRCGEPTLHARTAMWMAEELTGAKFRVARQPGGKGQQWLVECEGAALPAR